jgi:hypothetical protein
MKRLAYILLLMIHLQLAGQDITISLLPVFGQRPVVWNDSVYVSQQAGNVRFETLKLYISSIHFLKNGKTVFSENNSYHLLNAADPSSFLIKVKLPPGTVYDQFRFNLGIDSLTNVSGAMPGALDPSNGMYWTWQSGYINLKLEGSCSACPSRKNEFQCHLGGYQAPFNTLHTASFDISDSNMINLCLDLEKFVNLSGLQAHTHIMSPNAEAVRLSGIMRDCFLLRK